MLSYANAPFGHGLFFAPTLKIEQGRADPGAQGGRGADDAVHVGPNEQFRHTKSLLYKKLSHCGA